MKKYGNIISKLRKERGLTQEQLGKKLNVSYQAVSKWENNLSEPDLETIEKLTELFGISMSEFFNMTKDSKNSFNNTTNDKTKNIKDFIKNKPWYLVAILSIIIAILSLCAIFIPVKFSGKHIFNKYTSSIFYIQSTNSTTTKSGTGFFINNSGLAVTIYSNIKDYTNGKIRLNDGTQYNIDKIVGIDEENDIALIQIGIKNSKPVKLGNSNNISMGDKVFSITYTTDCTLSQAKSILSEGMIYKVESNSDGTIKLQTTASTQKAHKGGILVNQYGQIIGIISNKLNISGVGFDMINVCVPTNSINKIKQDINMSMEENYYRINNPILTFMSDGQKYYSASAEYNKTVNSITPAKTGYQFDGWFKDGQFSQQYDFSQGLKRNTTVYAKWTANTYKIKFITEFGSGSMQDLVCKYDLSYELPLNTFEYTHYSFAGWEYNGITYQNGQTISNLTSLNNNEIIFVAKWQLTEYAVEYISTNENVSVKNNNKLSYNILDGKVYLPNLIADYYIFLGWSTDGITTPQKNLSFEASMGGNKFFYSHWQPIAYDITYVKNNGVFEEVAPITYTYESGAQIPKITNGGYIFDGWLINGTNTIINDIPKLTYAKDLRLIAQWKDNIHTISFMLNNGDVFALNKFKTSQFPIEIKVSSVNDYHYFDYNFYLDANCTQFFSNYCIGEKIRFESASDYNLYINAVPATEGVVYEGHNILGYEGTSPNVYIADYHNDVAIYSVEIESFKDNQLITDVHLPQKVNHIMHKAFYNCVNLKNINFPESLARIYFEAFYNTALTKVELPENLEEFYDAFSNCAKLTSFKMSSKIKSFYSSAFSNCVSLNEIILPEKLEKLNYRCFYNCTSLNKLNIPLSVKYIGRDCLYNTGIYNNENNWIDNGLYYQDILFNVKNEGVYYKIKDGTKHISCELFYNSNIERVDIPQSVEINNSVFYNCNNLKYFEIPKHVTKIPNALFRYCYYLEKVVVHSNVVDLSDGFTYANSQNIKIFFECTKEQLLNYSVDDYYLESFNTIPKYYCSNNYIEGDNVWCWVNNNVAVWKDKNTLNLNGSDYLFSEQKPQADGNYWHYNQANEIILWENT